MLELLELGSSIVFTVGDAYGGGADVEVAVLMVATMWWLNVEVEFGIN